MQSQEKKVLVFGASGQLGSTVIEQLVKNNIPAAAFVRPDSPYQAPSGVQVVSGDLTNYPSVEKACRQQITHVIATASSIVPKKGDTFATDDPLFYDNIIQACQQCGVQHLIYISAFSSPYDAQVPEFVVKRQIEKMIVDSGIPYTIFRCAAFMDVYFAVMGSRLVTQGVAHPTLLRGYWLTRIWSAITSGILEKFGIALVPGNGDTAQSFICIEDVARCMIKAMDTPEVKNTTLELAGPEGRSWRDVADIYGEILNRRVFKLPLPIWLLKGIGSLLKRPSPAGANMMNILVLLASYEFTPEMKPLCEQLGLTLKDSRTYLTERLSNTN